MSVNLNYNFNFNFSGSTSANNGIWAGPQANGNNLLDQINQLLDRFEKLLDPFGSTFNNINRGGCYGHDFHTLPAPVEEPNYLESSQPSGSLKTNGNKITTAGGYTIEPLSQFEWKITGPDGKSTRIWGDPHVDEGDGGKWDFKNNSTFVLGDGTKINVTTAPYGNGMTVTSGLEIISGNDRVVVSDVDKGKGVIGSVTQDGYARANSFQGDVFVQGQETDDWSLQGKEILGSRNGGEKVEDFELGKELPAGRPTSNAGFERGIDQLLNRFTTNLLTNLFARALRNVFNNAFQPRLTIGANPLFGNSRPAWETGRGFNRNVYRQNLTRSFEDLSRMFNILLRLSNLSDRLTIARKNNIFA